MNRRWLFSAVVFTTFGLSACGAFRKVVRIPPTVAQTYSSYSYIPLDPLPVLDVASSTNSCRVLTDFQNLTFSNGVNKPILDSLPDQAVRVAVGQYDATGTLVYGPAKVGVSGQSYQVVLDYVSADTEAVPVYIERFGPEGKTVPLFDAGAIGSTYRVSPAATSEPSAPPSGERVIIPVYLGVGLRLTASVTVTHEKADLSSLGAIAASAESGKVTGTLVVQTLGVTGKTVSTTLPLPSELNRTTIQNAILALGSIKAVLYDTNTQITPRVVGIYNPIGGGQQVVNGIISILARDPIKWTRPCVLPETQTARTPPG